MLYYYFKILMSYTYHIYYLGIFKNSISSILVSEPFHAIFSMCVFETMLI